MIDPLVSLSFAIQGNKGVYALLLGSGVSRSASIPTGWEIVLDLARKLAAAQSEDAGTDAAEWFKVKYGKYPDYSELLDSLCKTPAERQQLLRSYFEPSPTEHANGQKQPTRAHRAIAKLMADGFIRVVLTTNFDRLLERALEEQGIAPVVISTADATEGALPLPHQTACIVKLHGDYLDSRIKNTSDELVAYDGRVDRLLDQVLNQFGLVVCGWSAQWDTALRSAFERAASRLFTFFWAAKDKPTPEAAKLISHRNGTVIDIADADSFFSKVQQMVEGLEQSNRQHPLSVEAVATLAKRFLADPNQQISLSDLVHDETESARKAVEGVDSLILKESGSRMDGAAVARAFERYRSAIERLQALAIQGGAWGGPSHASLWPQVIERLGPTTPENGQHLANWLRMYSPMVMLYSIGLAAIAKDRLTTLRGILYEPRLRQNSEKKPLIIDDFWGEMNNPMKSMQQHERDYAPRSEHLFLVLREPLRRLLPDDRRYDEAFDELEYLIALAYLDLGQEDRLNGPWAPPGRFARKARLGSGRLLKEAEAALKTEGTAWAPLRAGFCSGSMERATLLQAKLREFIGRLPWY